MNRHLFLKRVLDLTRTFGMFIMFALKTHAQTATTSQSAMSFGYVNSAAALNMTVLVLSLVAIIGSATYLRYKLG